MVFPRPTYIEWRKLEILSFLTRGKASTKEICRGIGMEYPTELEKVRSALELLRTEGFLLKDSGMHQAYYWLANRNDQQTAPDATEAREYVRKERQRNAERDKPLPYPKDGFINDTD